ncbi:hypothetical protein RJ640_018258 [Escallonia rubra]|uniref:Reverse transcriptase Ty1/copia-type domain-containing protein n=1 Tax=Escallonia rubra TaxID=112253 RepID=A0AA88QRX8_9ASTE|nr:hypothetical protein RJ640_018258 [Escallonia rubra]
MQRHRRSLWQSLRWSRRKLDGRGAGVAIGREEGSGAGVAFGRAFGGAVASSSPCGGEWAESCPYEHTLYVKTNKDGDIAIACFYVDDLIFIDNNSKFLLEFREDMIVQFEMKNIGLMSYFFGIEVKQRNKDIFISQKKYARYLEEN